MFERVDIHINVGHEDFLAGATSNASSPDCVALPYRKLYAAVIHCAIQDLKSKSRSSEAMRNKRTARYFINSWLLDEYAMYAGVCAKVVRKKLREIYKF